MYGKQSNWETNSSYETDSDSDSGDTNPQKQFSAQVHGANEYLPPEGDSAADWGKDVDSDDNEDVSLSTEETTEVENELAAIKLPEEELPSDHPIQECFLPEDDEGAEHFDWVFVKALYEMLEMSADSLLILSVWAQAISFNSFPVLPGIPMPRLQELTWAVPFPREPTVDPPFVTLPPPKKVRFPQLKRLYLTGRIIPETSRDIEEHCPNLLYLRSILDFTYFQDEVNQKADAPRDLRGRPYSPVSGGAPPSVIEHFLDVDCDQDTSSIVWLLNQHALDYYKLQALVDSRIKFYIYEDKGWNIMERDWQERISDEIGGWDGEECLFEAHGDDYW